MDFAKQVSLSRKRAKNERWLSVVTAAISLAAPIPLTVLLAIYSGVGSWAEVASFVASIETILIVWAVLAIAAMAGVFYYDSKHLKSKAAKLLVQSAFKAEYPAALSKQQRMQLAQDAGKLSSLPYGRLSDGDKAVVRQLIANYMTHPEEVFDQETMQQVLAVSNTEQFNDALARSPIPLAIERVWMSGFNCHYRLVSANKDVLKAA